MKRAEDLCGRWLDGDTLSQSELDEIAVAMDDDTTNHALLALMELESELRANRRRVDLRHAVMPRVEELARTRRLQGGVMAHIRQHHAAERKTMRFAWRVSIPAAAVLALALGLFSLLQERHDRTPGCSRPCRAPSRPV